MSETRNFRIQSGGAAYNLDVGFIPTRMIVENATKWATGGSKVKFYWNQGMAAGAALAMSSAGACTIEAANGFTLYDSSAVTANYKTVSGGITKANPGVVTVASTAGWVAGDALRFQNLVEMVELNNTTKPVYIKAILGGTTFSLDLDTSGYGAAETSVTGTVYNLSKAVEASGFKGVTLGATIMANDNDILYVTAILDDFYVNVGDVG